MSYKLSKYGNVIKVDGIDVILVPMEETSLIYQDYLTFLTNGGTVEQSNLYTQEEEISSNTPYEVALWKLRFILSQMSLEQSVTDAINQLAEPQKTAANYIWNYGNAIDRYSATVLYIQSSLEMSDNDVNSIFIQANNIVI